jgi:hypothetical protein
VNEQETTKKGKNATKREKYLMIAAIFCNYTVYLCVMMPYSMLRSLFFFCLYRHWIAVPQ